MPLAIPLLCVFAVLMAAGAVGGSELNSPIKSAALARAGAASLAVAADCAATGVSITGVDRSIAG